MLNEIKKLKQEKEYIDYCIKNKIYQMKKHETKSNINVNWFHVISDYGIMATKHRALDDAIENIRGLNHAR